MDELVVVRQSLDGQVRVGRPLGPSSFVDSDALVAQVRQPGPDRQDTLRIIAVEDDLPARKNTFRVEQPLDVGAVDAVQPGAREGDGSRDVSAPSLSTTTPAVVAGQRADVDDGEIGFVESPPELGG